MIALNHIRNTKAIHAKFRAADKQEKDKELMLAKRNYLIDPAKKLNSKALMENG